VVESRPAIFFATELVEDKEDSCDKSLTSLGICVNINAAIAAMPIIRIVSVTARAFII
jgi:hypothetical protein